MVTSEERAWSFEPRRHPGEKQLVRGRAQAKASRPRRGLLKPQWRGRVTAWHHSRLCGLLCPLPPQPMSNLGQSWPQRLNSFLKLFLIVVKYTAMFDTPTLQYPGKAHSPLCGRLMKGTNLTRAVAERKVLKPPSLCLCVFL